MNKPRVVFDFDGVIHSFSHPYAGDGIIMDKPVAGIREAIKEFRENGYSVAVVSSRCLSPEGLEATKRWLESWRIDVDEVTAVKLPAAAYIDDRAIYFDGLPENLLEKVRNLRPWNR